MALFLVILLTVVAAVAYRVTTPEDRKHYFVLALGALSELKAAAKKPRPEYDAFRDALRTRMRFALVTPAIALILAAVFIRMRSDANGIGDPGTLVAWGASLGTRTTNGEWWRLMTAAFVHTGTLHFLVDLAVLIQLGLILERLVGRLAVAAVYLSSGVFDGLVNLSSRPVEVTVAASGAAFGLYGLLLAALMWQTFHGWRRQPEPGEQEAVEEPVAPDVAIPPIAMKRLAIVGAVFLLYSAFSGRAGVAEFTGLLVGMIYGVVLARRAKQKLPRTRDAAYTMAAMVAVIVAAAIGIGAITDVRPELARVLALEERTTAAYQAEADALKKGRSTADALAELVEGTIVSELQAADARLEKLPNVPPEHRQAVDDARDYVRLRCASWRARGTAIRRAHAEPPRRPDGLEDTTTWRLQLQARYQSDLAARGNAESAERASREALQRVVKFLAART